MAAPQSIDAGDFSSWLHGLRGALVDGGGTDVPCGDCNACCSSFWYVRVRVTDEGALARIPEELLLPVPGQPDGHMQMGFDEEGRCPMLSGDLCSIYEDRPLTCRYFDCRIFTAAGVEAGFADTDALTTRIRQWRFNYPTSCDRDEHAAVQATGRFLQTRSECFPDGVVPANPTALASFAIKSYGAFLEHDSGDRGSEESDIELANALLAERDRFQAKMTIR